MPPTSSFAARTLTTRANPTAAASAAMGAIAIQSV